MKRIRTQLLLIIGGALVAVFACILLTSMLVNQFSLSASGAAQAAPADTATATASAPNPSDSASSASPSSTPSDSSSPAATSTASSSTSSTGVCASHVHYYASDTDREYEFGPPVTDDTKDAVIGVMKTRFCHGDPAFTSAIQGYTAYVHTDNSDELLGIDGQTDTFIHDHGQWRDEANALIAKLQAAAFTTADVPKGSSSLCMVAHGDTYSVTRCPTAEDGTAAVFTTTDGDVYYFRIDCGLQPISLTTKFPPVIPLAPKDPSVDPNARGHATQGGGVNANTGTDKHVAASDVPKPPTAHRTNPAPPSSSTSRSSSQSSSGSASGSGSATSSSGSASSSSSSTRSAPPPEQGAPDSSTAPSTTACAPGVTTC